MCRVGGGSRGERAHGGMPQEGQGISSAPRRAPRPFSSVMRTPASRGSRARRITAAEVSRGEAPRTKQHPESAAALGGELQAAHLARLRLPRPGERRIAGARAQRLLESPQRACASHDGHPLEHHAVRDEGRGKGHQRRGHPHAPAGAACAASAQRAPAATTPAHRCRNGQRGSRSDRCAASLCRADAHRAPQIRWRARCAARHCGRARWPGARANERVGYRHQPCQLMDKLCSNLL